MGTTIQRLYAQGQSVWCDNLSRGIIESGELQRLIDQGIVGVTSNPTIFMKAITGGSDYDDLLQRLLDRTDETMTLYEGLVLPDIGDAADTLRPVYDRTDGVDGFVSLEVNPQLACDTAGTVREARRLFAALDRPNVFIKVPATQEGIPAIETLLAEGVNVNVTLIFALSMYEQVMQAYINGVRRFLDGGGEPRRIASVASFFVSRVDTLVDDLLDRQAAAGGEVDHLRGRAGVANAKLAYARFAEVFNEGGPWRELAERGARIQRPLWASTSTKNQAYPDTLYVDNLVGPYTVNTLPPVTIKATLDHGGTAITIRDDLDGARRLFDELADNGIDMEAVTDKLRVDGVEIFARSFEELLTDLNQKKESVRAAG